MGERLMDNNPNKNRSDQFRKTVKSKITRHHKGKSNRNRLLFGMGMFGLVGWTIAIYTIGGVILGTWMDSRWESGYSWTLTMIILGLFGGITNAWIWIKRELDD
jgi:ATP synthase protein I